MKVALIVNAHSRKAKRNPDYVPSLEKAFGDRGPFICSRSPSELPEAMNDLLRSETSVVFISGGDGTLRQTLTHLIAAFGENPLPQIAILRGGTMNTVATSLGISETPLKHLVHLLQKQDQKVPFTFVRRPMLKINNYYGFIFGLGGFSRFIEHYQTEPEPTPFYAFKLLGQTLISMLVKGSLATTFFEEFSVNLWRNGQPWYQGTTVTNISASAIRHIGFHFKPYYGAEMGDDSFGLLTFKKLPTRLIFHLPNLFIGNPIEDPTVDQCPAKEILIKVEHPMRPMLDGDILKASQTFEIKAGPVLNLVVS